MQLNSWHVYDLLHLTIFDVKRQRSKLIRINTNNVNIIMWSMDIVMQIWMIMTHKWQTKTIQKRLGVRVHIRNYTKLKISCTACYSCCDSVSLCHRMAYWWNYFLMILYGSVDRMDNEIMAIKQVFKSKFDDNSPTTMNATNESSQKERYLVK